MIKNYLRLLATLLLLGAAAAQASGQNKITELSIASSGQGQSVLKVQLAEPLTTLPAGFSINAPARIALDFPATENGLGRTVQQFAAGDLRSANIIQAGTRTRLVLNLNQMVAYDAKLDGNAVLITLHGKAGDAAVAGNASRFADASKAAQKHALTDVDFRRGSNGEGRIQVDLSDPGLGIDIRRQGTRLIVDFLKTSLPRNLQRKLDVNDFATPVQVVDTFAQGSDTRMVIEPKGNWEHAAYQTDNKFIIEIKPVMEDANQLGLAKHSGYSGEKLTLNFQDITVREALNVIADFTELNMVISDTVQGNLTLRLKDVPWDQALDIILQSRGLDMRRSGNVIQVAPREELAAKEKTDLTARQEISQLEELQTESFRLGYARASDAANILMGKSTSTDQAGGGEPTGAIGAPAGDAAKGEAAPTPAETSRILSSRGSAMADARTNTLFVKDTPSRLDDVRRILKQIDVPARQVLIEARVVEANDGFAQNLGVRLSYTNPLSNPLNPATVAAGGANGVTGVRGGLVTAGAGLGMTQAVNTGNVNLPVTAGQPLAGLFQFSLFNAAASKILNVELNAMESDEQGKIISSPRVVSIDKDTQWAIIEQGEEIPYTINNVSNGVVTTTTAFKKAVLKLGVKTNITPDNNIDMTVEVRKDSRGTAIAGVPAINTNKVETKVLVENGGTVVIGGVYKQADSTVVNKVPLLGDIPILGNLFKSKGTSTAKSELLVFLSPKIMQDALNLR
ncbi:MAG: type IV pilus secretin PilQ [Gallionella sp.]|nr:type IV pilus secretin PilQ [Gallionella sp.]MDD4945252.1 type IV pilus secretin PilQ [Gallionella sp.]MDD5611592.1 type IV pilus secretin PilQ [Gallionella sp.]